MFSGTASWVSTIFRSHNTKIVLFSYLRACEGLAGEIYGGPMFQSRAKTGVVVTVIAAIALLSSCVAPTPPEVPEPATGRSPNDSPFAAEARYGVPGPYAAGVTTLQLEDRSVEVWYPSSADTSTLEPATYDLVDVLSDEMLAELPEGFSVPHTTSAFRDIPAATDGPFPMVIFSHGLLGFRNQSSFLTAHLASWGFVVVSPDYLEHSISRLGIELENPRSAVQVAHESMAATTMASGETGNLLQGTVMPGEKYAVGHSLGGQISLSLLDYTDVNTAIPLAMGSWAISDEGLPFPTGKNITWIGGRDDSVMLIDSLRTGFTYTAGERKLFELNRVGHNNAFTDLCEIGDAGILGALEALDAHMPPEFLGLAGDGCVSPPAATSPEVWPIVQHFVTAELRYRSGLDADPVGLGDDVFFEFDDLASYRHNP